MSNLRAFHAGEFRSILTIEEDFYSESSLKIPHKPTNHVNAMKLAVSDKIIYCSLDVYCKQCLKYRLIAIQLRFFEQKCDFV